MPRAGGGALCECVENALQDSFGIGQNVIVPEPQDAIAALFKPARSRDVSGLIGMLTASDFDDQLGLRTEKVDDVRSHRVLMPKAETARLLAA